MKIRLLFHEMVAKLGCLFLQINIYARAYDQHLDNETVIDTNHTGFYERNPHWASKGDSDKGIKLIFTISPATFVQATLSFRGTVTLTYEHGMSSMADLFDSRSRFSCKSFDSFNARLPKDDFILRELKNP